MIRVTDEVNGSSCGECVSLDRVIRKQLQKTPQQ